MNRLIIPSIFLFLTMSSCGLATSNEERIVRANENIQAGEYRTAVIELKNILATDPDNAAARLLLAKVSLGLGDLLAAEKELGRAAELHASESGIRSLHLKLLLTKRMFAEVLAALSSETGGLTREQQLSYRGEALLGLSETGAAQATYEEWLALDPESTDARLGIASAMLASGDLDLAIEELQRITKLVPGDVNAWQSLGVASFRGGDYAGAEVALNNAVEAIKPQSDIFRYARILAALVESQLALDKKDEARRNVDRLVGAMPNAPLTLFLAARVARLDGDYALASRHLQTLLNVSPDNGQAQMFLANMQMMQGNHAQAERLLHRVVAVSPDNVQARKLLARVQLQQSQPRGAIEALAPVLDSGEGDADLFMLLAQASLQEGDLAGAIRQFERASMIAPNDVEMKLNLASAYFDSDEIELALEVIEQVPVGAGALLRRERLLMEVLVAANRQSAADRIADQLLAKEERSEVAVTAVANHYVRSGRTDRARIVLRDSLNANADSVNIKNALARIEMADGSFDLARRLLISVVDTDESNLVALIGLARIAQQADEADEMERLLIKAAYAHSSALAPRVLLAREYLVQGKSEAAEKLANELVTIGFRNPLISEAVARIFADAGRADDALYHYQQAVKLNPEFPLAQLGIARAYLSKNQSVEGREALNRALEIVPGWPPAMTLLALVEMHQGQIDDAQKLIERFRSLHPNNVTAMVLEGEVNIYKQNFVAAAKAFGRAAENGAGRLAVLKQYQALVTGVQPNPEATLESWLNRNPGDHAVRTFFAQHYVFNNNGVRAIQEYQKILEHRPDDANILNNIAWAYQETGDLVRAAKFSEKAYSLNSASGSIADTLGWIYRELGYAGKSLEMLSEATRKSPENGEIRYHYAVVLSESGDKIAARQILEALKNDDAQFRSRALSDKLLGEL